MYGQGVVYTVKQLKQWFRRNVLEDESLCSALGAAFLMLYIWAVIMFAGQK